MIEVSHLVKEFKIPVQKKGRFAAVRNLFSSEHTIKRAVDDITFSVDDGEIVGFIGKNGAGKSTTIKMLSGILQPTSGNVTVDGIKPFEQRMENAKQIGVVFGQKTQLWWDVPLIESYRLLKEIYKIEDVVDEFSVIPMEYFKRSSLNNTIYSDYKKETEQYIEYNKYSGNISIGLPPDLRIDVLPFGGFYDENEQKESVENIVEIVSRKQTILEREE